MIPSKSEVLFLLRSRPRASGDDPGLEAAIKALAESTPRERG